MNNKHIITTILISLVFVMALPLSVLASTGQTTRIELKNNPIYKSFTFHNLYSSYQNISKDNVGKTKEDSFSCYVKINTISKNYKKITVADPNGSNNGTIEINAKTSHAIDEVKKLYVGETVKLFGTFTGAANNHLTLDIAEIIPVSQVPAEIPEYEFFGGKNGGRQYFSKQVTEHKLGDGAMTFKVPYTWDSTEEKADDGLDGFKYCLNNIQSEKRSEPELVYIFYFDYDKYIYTNDKADDNLIEKAIIQNILPEEKFVLGTYIRTNQKILGKTIDHYTSKYDKYNAEFFFSKAPSGGLACILYLYGQYDVHREDIIYILRTLETK